MNCATNTTPAAKIPFVTIGVFAACVFAFLWQSARSMEAGQQLIQQYGLIPSTLLEPWAQEQFGMSRFRPWLTVFSSMFLHGGWLHLVGNLLYLLVFAGRVEVELGHTRFALLYLLSGMVAAVAQSLAPGQAETPIIGASGAISGVLGAYALRFPRANLLIALPRELTTLSIRIPALLVLGLWFALQLVSEFRGPDASSIAFRAHIGGFLGGIGCSAMMRPTGLMQGPDFRR